jgi:fluoride ion exporter CrcB/FEX
MTMLLASVTLTGILAAGAAGAVLRGVLAAWRPVAGTHAANLVGTLLLAVTLVARDRGVVGDALAAIIGIGFCGSLTTFSGWMALLDGTLRAGWVRALLRDVAMPLVAGVLLTVLAFATLAA